MENRLIPFEAVTSLGRARALVLAPHPDDEVFGCGGAILRHVNSGDSVHVIVVTDGDYMSHRTPDKNYGATRRDESCAAAKLLGYGTPEFWGFKDRTLTYGEQLVARIESAIKIFSADLVYAPSLHEMHPDHRALAMAALEAVRRTNPKTKLVMYEVGVPMPRPNTLLDISDLVGRKQDAMSCFASQLKEQAYDQQIAALNRFRTYTLGPHIAAAEAYLMVQVDSLKNDTLDLYESEHQRQRGLGLLMVPEDSPLVSVIVRSMDRQFLSDALDSVAIQTYPNVEVVVVGAKEEGHSALGLACGRFPLRVVQAGHALDRAAAANFGIDCARGKYCIFLDDDDFFLPDHLAKLTQPLIAGKARATYTGVKVVDNEGHSIFVLDEPWDVDRLRGANFLPIHSVLFERTLAESGCRFRENLTCLEDWDFWLQVSVHTAFQHVPGVSAVYRIALGTSGLSLAADFEKHLVNRAAIFDFWLQKYTSREWVRSIFWFENSANQFKALASQRLGEVQQLDSTLAETNKALSEMSLKLGAGHAHTQRLNEHAEQLNRHIEQLNQRVEHLNQRIHQLNQTVEENSTRANTLHQTVVAMVGSTSWKITGPLRFAARIGRGQFRQAFSSLHRRFLALADRLGIRLPAGWKPSPTETIPTHNSSQLNDANNYPLALAATSMSGIVDIAKFAPLAAAPDGSIAVHAHVFYADVAPEFATYLGHMPFDFDLFVSVPSEDVLKTCKESFKEIPRLKNFKVAVVPNRGRDMAPMFCAFGKELSNYDYLAHIHSKKSLYNNGATEGWREYLLQHLLGSEQQIRRIFTLLSDDEGFGFVYPQNFHKLPYQANTWLSNKAMGSIWCNKLGIPHCPTGYFDFPAGSMFWARMSALKPLFELGLSLDDFPEEAGQKDATVAHCLERMFVLTANQSTLKAAILRDTASQRWSPWGFEQYIARTKEYMKASISAPGIKVVVFDIFDTLLARPLLNPESTKSIVSKTAGGHAGDVYLQLRPTAEIVARSRAGRDVDLNTIFDEFSTLSGLALEDVTNLHKLEETIELESVCVRPEVAGLLQFALACGKRVALASDMYLPRRTIELMLKQHGIVGWHHLYLSSEIGLRKDSGEMYRHMLQKECLSPTEMLMIGDNEHSDVQIPGDMGLAISHVMRPVELARAVPRLGALINQALPRNDLNEQIALGLLARENFSPVFYPKFDPFSLFPPSHYSMGYSVLGPLVLSFAQWLARTASTSRVKKLYFLSREGEFLKQVYDKWAKSTEAAPPSEYIVLSRRAVTVPMISSAEDIESIARSIYFTNSAESFFSERFGLELSTEEWSQLQNQGLFGRDQAVEVMDGQIDHLKPMLEALTSRIFSQAATELPGLLAYLDKMGLNDEGTLALVDVGYAATIQGRLNQLLNRQVHGYYMVTDTRADGVSKRHSVAATGCFGHHLSIQSDAPPLLVKSFAMEKLLSSDQPQIIRYTTGPHGDIEPHLRRLTTEELQTQPIRAEVRKGAMKFVDDAIAARTKLYPEFEVPTALARSLYEALVEQPSETEELLLKQLVLDDYYCGRGLVS